MDRFRVLVVDDEPTVCEAVKAILAGEDIDVAETTSSVEAVRMIADAARTLPTGGYDIVITDMRMPDVDGMSLYEAGRESSPDTAFIIITAYGTVQSAVDAIKRGVYDYILKPFTPDEVRIPVRRALEKMRLRRENLKLRSQIETRYSFKSIIGNSPPMRDVFRIMRHASASESNVLVTGESGTGKELVARAVHSNSVRAKRPFVAVNCGAIPEGLMESELFGYARGAFTGAASDKIGLIEKADKGTLFLDEVGELPVTLQVKLLRVLQDGEFLRVGDANPRRVNVCVISATNRDIKRAIAEKTFREDLYYRLNVIPIELPPLRDRKEDIPLLASHFIEKHSAKAVGRNVTGLSKEALQALVNYHFPGNVRELENAVEYAMAFASGSMIQPDELPRYIIDGGKLGDEARSIPIMPLRDAKVKFEKGLIMAALIESGGNVSEAARLLNVHRQNLQQKIRLLGIDMQTFPNAS
ncbi:MAG: sigma-54-dependent Fis family transcriptional regulator [Nitrospirae bacterium]|nr:sigma-54-dependent Fis family transcriptional regulator [Nitrospirota bacterium]